MQYKMSNLLTEGLRKCARSQFLTISHEWLLSHISMDRAILRKWLKAGVIVAGLVRSQVVALCSSQSLNHSTIWLTWPLSRSNRSHAPVSTSTIFKPTISLPEFVICLWQRSIESFSLMACFIMCRSHPLAFGPIARLSVARIPASTVAFCQDRHLSGLPDLGNDLASPHRGAS